MFRKTKRNRQSLRLPGFDYSRPGFYFITICTLNREHLFCTINNGVIELNEFGKLAADEWVKTGILRDNILIDEFVIMPNHMHGILQIPNPCPSSVRAYRDTPQRITSFRSPSNNLGSAIRGYKSSVSKQINLLRKTPGRSVWQRNYYEHIIRNEDSLHRIREYIALNPCLWEKDRFNSAH